jgi:murein peptide amidase A
MNLVRRRTALLMTLALLCAAALPAVLSATSGRAGAATSTLVMKRITVGTSVRGRHIYAWHRYFPGATKRVVMIGSIHGDERAGLRVYRELKLRTPPANLDLYLIRTVNPDGVVADRRTNAHGVDLNRNFPYHWQSGGAGTETWSGPSAASEPETRAVIRFIRDLDPRLTFVFHQPLHGVGTSSKRPHVARVLADAVSLPLKDFECGSSGCHGTLTMWENARTSGATMTVEFGPPGVPDWRIRRAARAVLSVGSRY